jgi:hypothetical protein
MPTFSMLVAAYGLVERTDHQASAPAAMPAGAPISRMLMPCEAPFCDRVARALVCEFHRPGVLT